MNKMIFCAVAFSALGGCAKRPSAIVPADIPMAAYTNLSCEQLAQEQVKEQTGLTGLAKAQNDAATGDAFGVFLIGIPIGSAVGADKEGDLAVSKGKVQAIQSATMSKGCNSPAAMQQAAGAQVKK